MHWEPLADNVIPYPSPNKGYPGKTPHWRAVTWHIADGTLDGTLSWLTSPVSQASAHVVIGRAGEIYSLVSLDEPAWAQGNVCDPDRSRIVIAQTADAGVNPNLVSYSIECVGHSTYGQPGSLTEPQRDALIRVTAFMCLRSRLTADRDHIFRHGQWDSCTRPNCPGYSVEEMQQWIGRVRQWALLWRGW
jgi:N-acetyl-anhydromuramyl-L-alanine amidase AmpD